VLWGGVVGEVAEDGSDLVGEADGDRPLLGEAGGVPVHLGEQQHLGEELLVAGVADVVGDLKGGGDMAVGVAARGGSGPWG